MGQIKKYRIILACSFCVYIFIVVDTFLMPEKIEKESIVDKKSIIRKSKGRASTFTFITANNSYLVDQFFYNTVSNGDSLIVTKSVLTNVTKNIARPNNGFANSYNCRFLIEGSGIIFIPFFAFAILLSFIFMPNLVLLKGEKNASIGLTIFTFLLLLGYLFYF
jgi:hypothetical protein